MVFVFFICFNSPVLFLIPPKIFRFEMKKKLNVKILAANNIIRRTRRSWPPSLSRAVDCVNKITYCFGISEKSASKKCKNQ